MQHNSIETAAVSGSSFVVTGLDILSLLWQEAVNKILELDKAGKNMLPEELQEALKGVDETGRKIITHLLKWDTQGKKIFINLLEWDNKNNLNTGGNRENNEQDGLPNSEDYTVEFAGITILVPLEKINLHREMCGRILTINNETLKSEKNRDVRIVLEAERLTLTELQNLIKDAEIDISREICAKILFLNDEDLEKEENRKIKLLLEKIYMKLSKLQSIIKKVFDDYGKIEWMNTPNTYEIEF